MHTLSLLIFTGFRFRRHVRKKCYDVLMTAYKLKDIAILRVGRIDFSRDEAVNRLNNCVRK